MTSWNMMSYSSERSDFSGEPDAYLHPLNHRWTELFFPHANWSVVRNSRNNTKLHSRRIKLSASAQSPYEGCCQSCTGRALHHFYAKQNKVTQNIFPVRIK